jgi:hypothetical protein
MADVKYLFIFITPGCDPAVHRSVIETPEGPTITVGVAGVGQACEVAKAAVDAGEADFIELCGAFREEGCRKVIDAVADRVPVGYVTYRPGDSERVDALFG